MTPFMKCLSQLCLMIVQQSAGVQDDESLSRSGSVEHSSATYGICTIRSGMGQNKLKATHQHE